MAFTGAQTLVVGVQQIVAVQTKHGGQLPAVQSSKQQRMSVPGRMGSESRNISESSRNSARLQRDR